MIKTLKRIWFKTSGKLIFPLVKIIYSPTKPVSRKLRFIGNFKVRTMDGKCFYLFNNAFPLETNIFWIGIDKYDWEKMTRYLWTELSKSSHTIFDIGSNSGIFAVLAKAYNTNSMVVAFEPQPNIFNVLKMNNKVNGFDIHCENIALSNQEGNMPFYNSGEAAFTTENTTAGSLNKEWRPERQNSILVSVKQLQNYIEDNKIKSIDLIKIDVETFEYEVLSGYGKYLKLHEPIIIIEIQDKTIGKNIESLVDAATYSFYNIYEDRGLIKVENLGVSEQDHNYLLCPQSKLDLIKKYILVK